MNLPAEDPVAVPAGEIRLLQIGLAASQAENARLRELLAIADRVHVTASHHLVALNASEMALASSRAETKEGQIDLRASEAALASSRAETKEGQTDLLASELALASSRAETKVGQTDLRASEMALLSSRAETQEGRTDLRQSTLALASSLAESKEGQVDLRASEVALASSRAEIKDGQADLAASEIALASAPAEAKEGKIELRASEVALASSRAETRDSQADLAAGVLALASSLRNSDEQFHRLFESAPIAIVMVNPAGQIKMVNASTERLFGYTRSDLIGAPVELLMPAGSRDWSQGIGRDVAAGRTLDPVEKNYDLFGQKKDRSQIQLEIGFSVVESAGETMVLSAIVDISNRVRLETQLRQAQKMEAIGRMAAGIAHDFNNLLLALGGSLELLLDAVADEPDAMEWGRIALRAAARGKELTDRLLSFSRKEVLTARPVVIIELFNELHGLINHLFDSRSTCGIELVIVPCTPDLAALADFARLGDALINLAVNARDAMAEGGRLYISAYESDADPAIVPPGKYTVISVVDTGTGMDAQTLARACEPFFSTKSTKGTGLGLSMVHGFARQSGGDMQISSAVGKGTTVDLWLPSARVPAESKQPIVPSAQTVEHTTALSDSQVVAPARMVGRVLVVDDSPDTLHLVSEFLRRAGLEVTSVIGGELALAELVAGERFDALVSDFTMPGMDGLELLGRAHEIDPSMIVMLIAAVVEPELLSGLSDIVVLRKPFKRAELIDTLRKLIAANGTVALT